MAIPQNEFVVRKRHHWSEEDKLNYPRLTSLQIGEMWGVLAAFVEANLEQVEQYLQESESAFTLDDFMEYAKNGH